MYGGRLAGILARLPPAQGDTVVPWLPAPAEETGSSIARLLRGPEPSDRRYCFAFNTPVSSANLTSSARCVSPSFCMSRDR